MEEKTKKFYRNGWRLLEATAVEINHGFRLGARRILTVPDLGAFAMITSTRSFPDEHTTVSFEDCIRSLRRTMLAVMSRLFGGSREFLITHPNPVTALVKVPQAHLPDKVYFASIYKN